MTAPAPIDTTIDRRAFLRVLAVLGAGGALAACGGSGGHASQDPSSAASATSDPGEEAVSAVAPDAEVSLAVVAATFEQLIDQPNPFVFGLFTLEQEPIEGASAQVYAVPSNGGEPVGPWSATPADVDVPPGGLYTVDAAFPSAGLHEVVVVTDDGQAGTVAVDVRDASSSQLPAPGQQAQAVATPTEGDPLGYTTLCTREQPCGMHEVSLDEALLAGQPIVLLFATPAFCQTAVCGPTVDVVEKVRRNGFDDVQFIHCEIFSDEGSTLGEPVQAWNLPTEPWLFVIDPDGRIVRRADGPLLVLADQVRSLINDGLSA
ncbi:MAG TPA: hypothetical protein VK923_10480 [Euzebyales bacterium]|nr:hypothetical protein [Euzebyales bacterium]